MADQDKCRLNSFLVGEQKAVKNKAFGYFLNSWNGRSYKEVAGIEFFLLEVAGIEFFWLVVAGIELKQDS